MTAKKICFDFETIPSPAADPFNEESVALGNLKDPVKISEKIEAEKAKHHGSLGLDIHQNMICSFAWCDGEDAGYTLINETDEKEIILTVWDKLAEYDFFITFNGNSFDVPMLNIHSMFQRIRVPFQISTRKYQVTNHCDLRAVLSNWETFAKGNLDFWLNKCLGINKYEGMTGAMVTDAWEMGLYQKVGEYNQDDAEKTWKLYQHVREYLPALTP